MHFYMDLTKKFTKCIIKSRKISSIEQLLAHTSRKNKERDTNWRSDDMLTCEILLKKMRQECELKTSKIRNRAVDLNIATIVENSLKIKTRRIMFGTITPKSIYMEYNLMLIRVKNKLSKVQELINKLSSVDVSDYIGNVTMKERSQKATKARKTNSTLMSLKRENEKKKKEKEKKDHSIELWNSGTNGVYTAKVIGDIQLLSYILYKLFFWMPIRCIVRCSFVSWQWCQSMDLMVNFHMKIHDFFYMPKKYLMSEKEEAKYMYFKTHYTDYLYFIELKNNISGDTSGLNIVESDEDDDIMD
eukprot:97479_1